ncbi:MAG: hypothetical protein FJ280_27755 [Planctomycetes bacterium]|nr:hypothetical protein [Planctomycetota bacterium]
MGLLKPIENEMAYLKAGIFGFQGSGKTYTASLIAKGLHAFIASKKPVAFFDTETGSSFVLPMFREAGIELVGVKGRAFKDLLDFVREAEGATDVAIIDSITHVWREFVKAYMTKTRLRFLRIQDWGPLKQDWQAFTDLYVNSRVHVVMCGRAGNIFEDVREDDEDASSKWKAVKVGTKMSAETETGYEPSLLLEMEKVYLKDGGKYVRRCHVIKDRFAAIDSAEFDDPAFENFLPHIRLLNIGGAHLGVDTTRTSEELFDEAGNAERSRRDLARKIALEKIEAAIVDAFPGQSAKEKRAKGRIVEAVFRTKSWTEVTRMDADRLTAEAELIEHVLRKEETVNGLLEDDWNANHADATLASIREEMEEAKQS